MELSHINENGRARMVAVNEKAVTQRTAVASGQILMQPQTLQRIKSGGVKKGDVLATAQIAGIMASKKTSETIPMCHNVPLEGCDIDFEYLSDVSLGVSATVTATAKTGVEMEALNAVSAALLTVYDMLKAVDRGMVISQIMLMDKTGGKSGEWHRDLC